MAIIDKKRIQKYEDLDKQNVEILKNIQGTIPLPEEDKINIPELRKDMTVFQATQHVMSGALYMMPIMRQICYYIQLMSVRSRNVMEMVQHVQQRHLFNQEEMIRFVEMMQQDRDSLLEKIEKQENRIQELTNELVSVLKRNQDDSEEEETETKTSSIDEKPKGGKRSVRKSSFKSILA